MAVIRITSAGLKKYETVLSEIIDIEKLKSRLPQKTSWIRVGTNGAPAFKNSWSNAVAFNQNAYIPSIQPLEFRRDELGVVHLRGHVDNGNAGVIFTLPNGFRPAKGLLRPCGYETSQNSVAPIIVVSPNGDVATYNSDFTTPIDLSAISFYLD